MDIKILLKIILISIVQGITEWLPVSSTGHMILLEEFLNLNVRAEFWDLFLVVVQLGSILAVIILFFNKINPFSRKKTKEENRNTLNMWIKVLVAIIPAAIIGILFDDIFNDLFYNYITVAATLIIYGIAFIIIENKNKDRLIKIDDVNKIDFKTAFLIGCFQILALIPGTSRSGSTIIGGMILGLSRTAAAEFSFFMAIPVMIGASLVKIYKYGFNFTNDEIILLSVGVVVAFVVSLLAIKFLMNFIKKHSFKEFGYYRIGLGIIVIAYFLAVTLSNN